MNRSSVCALGAAAAVAVLAAVLVGRGGIREGAPGAAAPAPSAPASASPAVAAPVGVDELMKQVERYRGGSVDVEGVVSAAAPDQGALALIDRREFEQCGLECAELTLPIRWSGPMPAPRETVRIRGEIREEGGKLMLVAQAVQILPSGAPR